MDLQLIAAVATIIASMYGMLKFMLKDTHKEVEILKEGQKKFDKEHEEFKKELRHVHDRFDRMENRLDGLYRVLLDKTYGKNIPDELK